MSWLWRNHPLRSIWDRRNAMVTFGKRDILTLGDLFENVLVLGATGAGKTSGTSYAISMAMLAIGMGGLVMVAKSSEVKRWKRMCEQAGRSNDLIIVSPDSGHEFNIFDYVLGLQGRSGTLIENIIALFDAVGQIVERASGTPASRGGEQFFEIGIQSHTRNTASLVVYATDSISVPHMLEVLRDVPQSLEQASKEEWRQQSLIVHLIHVARQKHQDKSVQHDLDQIEAYFLKSFPAIAMRTRSIFEAGVFGKLDILSRGVLHKLFGRGTNVSPDMCREGKIIVLDLSIAEFGMLGCVAQTIFKRGFQIAAELKKPDEERAIFNVVDEFQAFVTSSDFTFASVSREARVVNLWLTQSIASLQAVLGTEAAGQAACESLLGLANVKIFHSNSCPVTNAWASDVIGKRRKFLFSMSTNHPSRPLGQWYRDEPGYGSSSNESLEYAIQPSEYTRIRKGGAHGYCESIVFAGGRVWSNNETYLKVSWKQGY